MFIDVLPALVRRWLPVRQLSASVIEKQSAFYWTFGCLAIALCLPLLATQTPALLDYPNHLARVFILTHWNSDPQLQTFYRINWQPIPNLALDGLGVVLNRILPIFLTGQIILLTAAMLLATGIVALSAALYHRPQFGCLLGFFFVFSEMFVLGFVNVLLGFGLCLWATAAYCWLRKRKWWLSILGSAAFAIVLYFAHLFAFAAYGLIIVSFEFAQQLRERNIYQAFWRTSFVVIPQFVMPLAIYVFLSPVGLKTGNMSFGSWTSHLSMILSPVRNYSDSLDIATFLILTGLIIWGISAKRLTVSREMQLTLLVLATMSFLIPDKLASGNWVMIRLPTLAMLILAASFRWEPRRTRELVSVVLVLVLLFCVRTTVVAREFDRASVFARQMRTAMVKLPNGSRIGSLVLMTPTDRHFDPEWAHSVCFAVIDKSALVPTLFSSALQQPVLLAASNHYHLPDYIEVSSNTKFDLTILQNLDYLIVINERVLRRPFLPPLESTARGTNFTIYRVRRRTDTVPPPNLDPKKSSPNG
jgi:hypothetical protein